MSGKLKLYGFTGSNSVYTGRLMLEHKGLDYDFVKLPPAVHAPTMLMLGFPTMGVPAIKVDGVRVQGTRWIARALDELYPDKPLLFPTDPAQRRKVQDAERWGEDLQNAVRRIFYCAARRDRKAFLSVLGSGRGPGEDASACACWRRSSSSSPRVCTAPPTRPAARTSSCCPSAWTRSTRGSPRASSAASSSTRPTSRSASTSRRCMLSEDLSPFVERPARPRPWRGGSCRTTCGHIGPVVPAEWMEQLRAADSRRARRPSVGRRRAAAGARRRRRAVRDDHALQPVTWRRPPA